MNTVGRLTRFTLHKALSPVLKDGAQRNLVVSSTMTGFKGVGFYWILRVIGLDPSPLLAVFGMFGAAVGFAGKDLVSNFISGATLAASNTFRKGDKITVGSGASSISGTLINMDMKYLYLEQPDGTLLLIPNSSVTTSVVAISNGVQRFKSESAIDDDHTSSHLTPEALAKQAKMDKMFLSTIFIFIFFPFLICCTLVGLIATGQLKPEHLEFLAGKKDGDESPQNPELSTMMNRLKNFTENLRILSVFDRQQQQQTQQLNGESKK